RGELPPRRLGAGEHLRRRDHHALSAARPLRQIAAVVPRRRWRSRAGVGYTAGVRSHAPWGANADSDRRVLAPQRPGEERRELERADEPVTRPAEAGAPSKIGESLAESAAAARACSERGPCGGGAPLPVQARAFFEPRFGRDFGGVRVHDDAGAHAVAADLRARALTVGRDVYFGAGQYAPS